MAQLQIMHLATSASWAFKGEEQLATNRLCKGKGKLVGRITNTSIVSIRANNCFYGEKELCINLSCLKGLLGVGNMTCKCLNLMTQ